MAMSYFSISSGDKSQVLSEVIFTFICCFSPYVKAPGRARRRFEQEFSQFFLLRRFQNCRT